jgi:YggT family protein
VTAIVHVVILVLQLLQLILLARVVIDYVFIFARDWHPRGPVLLLVEGIYSVTDPPLRLIRRFVPPLRIGRVSLDLALLVLFVLLWVAIVGLSQI